MRIFIYAALLSFHPRPDAKKTRDKPDYPVEGFSRLMRLETGIACRVARAP